MKDEDKFNIIKNIKNKTFKYGTCSICSAQQSLYFEFVFLSLGLIGFEDKFPKETLLLQAIKVHPW